MGCNCGGKASQVKYIYTDAQGRQHTYSTEIEAKAAQIRGNGAGNVRAVPK